MRNGPWSPLGKQNITRPPSIIWACTKRAGITSTGPPLGPGGKVPGGRSCAPNRGRNATAMTATDNRRFIGPPPTASRDEDPQAPALGGPDLLFRRAGAPARHVTAS